MHEAHPAFQYATLPQQHDAAQLGMWTFLATEVLFFGGLIVGYFVYRFGYPADFAAAGRHTKIAIGAINTGILLTSSFLVAWAVTAAKLDLGRVAARLLVLATLLGAIFLVLKGYEYLQEFHERLVPGRNFQFDAAHARGAMLFFMFPMNASAIASTRWRNWVLETYSYKISDFCFAPSAAARATATFISCIRSAAAKLMAHCGLETQISFV